MGFRSFLLAGLGSLREVHGYYSSTITPCPALKELTIILMSWTVQGLNIKIILTKITATLE